MNYPTQGAPNPLQGRIQALLSSSRRYGNEKIMQQKQRRPDMAAYTNDTRESITTRSSSQRQAAPRSHAGRNETPPASSSPAAPSTCTTGTMLGCTRSPTREFISLYPSYPSLWLVGLGSGGVNVQPVIMVNMQAPKGSCLGELPNVTVHGCRSFVVLCIP